MSCALPIVVIWLCIALHVNAIRLWSIAIDLDPGMLFDFEILVGLLAYEAWPIQINVKCIWLLENIIFFVVCLKIATAQWCLVMHACYHAFWQTDYSSSGLSLVVILTQSSELFNISLTCISVRLAVLHTVAIVLEQPDMAVEVSSLLPVQGQESLKPLGLCCCSVRLYWRPCMLHGSQSIILRKLSAEDIK